MDAAHRGVLGEFWRFGLYPRAERYSEKPQHSFFDEYGWSALQNLSA